MTRNVRVVRPDGTWRFNRLLDDGGDVLRFASGFGWVSRRDMERDGCRIVDGWAESQRVEVER